MTRGVVGTLECRLDTETPVMVNSVFVSKHGGDNNGVSAFKQGTVKVEEVGGTSILTSAHIYL